MKHCLLALPLLVGLGAGACAAPRMPAFEAAREPAARAEIAAALAALPAPPASSRSKHRALYTRAGSEFDFNVVLHASAPDFLRIAALDDLGGTLFHLARSAEGVEVVKTSALFPAGFLEHGLVAGLHALLSGRASAESGRAADGAPALRYRAGAADMIAWPQDGAYVIGRGGHLDARLRVAAWDTGTSATGAPARFPREIEISDARGRCSLVLRLLEWSPGAAP